jgi:hypothetical protein
MIIIEPHVTNQLELPENWQALQDRVRQGLMGDEMAQTVCNTSYYTAKLEIGILSNV